ncbi:MAG: fibrobacter succinogenes major paralogous domain-containing protein [Candidatus Cryptobacteroides sp.]
MKFNFLKSIVFPTLMAAAVISCKKDDDDTTLPSLDGSISFYAPEFISPLSSLKMTPKGASHPEGEDIGYYWKVSPTMSTYDTTKFVGDGTGKDSSFVYEFPDSIGTYTIYCYSYAPGYTGISGVNYVTTIKNGLEGSVTGRSILPSDPSFKDSDGNVYYYTAIGNLEWFRQNLCSAGGSPFRKSQVMSDLFGRFYSYEEALTACPEGWRLPTEEDWMDLCTALGASPADKYSNVPGLAAKLMADAQFNTITMWEYWKEVGDITNESMLAMIPVGYANLGDKAESPQEDQWLDLAYPNASFKGIYEYAIFWTADACDADLAYYRYLYVQSSELKVGTADRKYFGAPVRCVRDKQ